MSKKVLLLCMSMLLVSMVFISGCSSDKQAAGGEKVLKVGTNADFAPFEFVGESGKDYQGFDMDLIRAIGKEMGYQVEISSLYFDGLIPALDAGNFDVCISGIGINEERKEKVLFSDPYYRSGLSVIVAKDNESIKTFDDLKEKRVAVQLGTISAAEVKKMEGVEVLELNSTADTFMALRDKAVDAVVNARPVNDYYIKSFGESDVKALPDLQATKEYGIAVAKKNEATCKLVNAALKKLHENGEYDKIYEKWFGSTSK